MRKLQVLHQKVPGGFYTFLVSSRCAFDLAERSPNDLSGGDFGTFSVEHLVTQGILLAIAFVNRITMRISIVPRYHCTNEVAHR